MDKNKKNIGDFDPRVFDRMQVDEPVAIYIKTIIGKLAVTVWNHLTDDIDGIILRGDPRDPKTDIDDITIKLWDEKTKMYFENINKQALQDGKLVPYTREKDRQEMFVNMLTEEEIVDILGQKYFTLDNKLNELTSQVPVRRILEKAVELDRPIKTINRIKERLEELQDEEGIDNDAALKEYYKNANVEV